MYPVSTFVSVLCLATSAFSQYGGYDYGSNSDTSSTDASGSNVTPEAAPASSPPDINTAPPAGTVNVHVVKVSNKDGALKFEPNNLKAEVGELVQFQFWPKSHSVVRSTFDQPCIPIQNVNASAPDFFSGFMPVEADATTRPTYSIVVNDTSPIWYYCSRDKHCQNGMVGVINPPAKNQSRTIDSFTKLAAQAPDNVSPSVGEISGGTNGSISTGSTSTGTSGSDAPGTTTAASAPFTGAANVFANRQGTLASLGITGVLGLFVVFL